MAEGPREFYGEAVTSVDRHVRVGPLLRSWRERRRLSQLDLASLSSVSARHVSFLETGRSRPTRAMVLRLADHLDVPLRDRNSLLLAAGFAPEYPENDLAAPELRMVSHAVRTILDGLLPHPALVVDHHWTLIDANAAVDMLLAGCAPGLLEPPVNVLRLSLHPDGLAPRIDNRAQWRAHVLARLDHQISVTSDTVLTDLRAELASYGPASGSADTKSGNALVVPLRLWVGSDLLSFVSTTTVFGTPLDITVAELAIESFFPADRATAAVVSANTDVQQHYSRSEQTTLGGVLNET